MNSNKKFKKKSQQLKNKINVMASVVLYYGVFFHLQYVNVQLHYYLKQSQGLLHQLSIVNKWWQKKHDNSCEVSVSFRHKITEHPWIKARSTVKYNEGPEGGISIPLKLFNPQFPFFYIFPILSDLNHIFPEQQHPILPLQNSPQWIQRSTLPSKQISILFNTNEQLYIPATGFIW